MATKYDILKYYLQILKILEDAIGVGIISNIKLDNICGKILNNYIGTYSSNDLPRMKNNDCAIVNTDDNKHPGVHFCALYKYRNKFYFYDSFARDYK